MMQWYVVHLMSIFRMISEDPLVLEVGDALLADDMERWLQQNYLGKCLSPPGALASQLAKQLQLGECVLRARAHEEFLGVDLTLQKICDRWLTEIVVSKEEYATKLVLLGSTADGLLPLLVACFAEVDITVVHGWGLWTTKATTQGSTEDNIFLVYMDQGF